MQIYGEFGLRRNHSSQIYLNSTNITMIHNITKSASTIFLVDLNKPFTAFEYVYFVALALFALCVFLCIASCAIGLAFWVLIPRWRMFQNYVFLNVFFSGSITMTCYFLVSNLRPQNDTHQRVITFVFVLSRIVMCHWLLVATVMFYMDIVKVFQSMITHKYLLVNLYAWFLPVIEVSILFAVAIPLKIDSKDVELFTCVALILSLMATGLVYLRVMYTLISLAVRNIGCKKDVCHKIILCTAAGITSGVSTFLPVVVAEIVFRDDYLVINSICIFTLLHIIAIVVFFWSMRVHRTAWREYWRRRRSVTSLVDEIVF